MAFAGLETFIATIANSHGSPYTEDFNLVFVPLQPVTVMASLVALARDALQLVEVAAVGAEVAPAGLTLRALASARPVPCMVARILIQVALLSLRSWSH